jgi:transglutaminase-like putative cysteine protease
MAYTTTLDALRHVRQLPRDARDTLFSLAVVAWTVLPHASNLPVWCVALSGLMLLWRAQLALTGRPLPGRWTVAFILAVACGLTWWSERTLLGKEAGVTLLVVLISLKTLELRARRDALVMFFLGFFLVLTHFLYSQSLGVALSMLLSVWGLLTALVLSHMPVGRPSLARAGGLALRSALLGAPVMLALFLLFPRFGPLWGMPSDAAGRTGLSGSLRLGHIAELANDDSIAMRVRFLDAAPSPSQMYFRGPVLSNFNGREWTRLTGSLDRMERLNSPPPRPGGRSVRYEMTLEPSRLPLLPLLELTPQRPGSAPVIEGLELRQRTDLEWMTDRPITERLRFEAQAFLDGQHGPLNPQPGLQTFLQLPPEHAPRVRAWVAERLASDPALREGDATFKALALMREIRTAGFSYTLAPGTYGTEAIDEFWLDRRAGFCEHYAASTVFILRLMGVPARIVTGYQGTDPMPVDGYYIVRQSHAHAWAEYWQDGRGWLRLDPTAAVAPDRIDRSANLAPPPGLVAGALGNVDPELLARIREVWEALDNRWNQYVLNYSRSQQFDLLKQLGIESPNWTDLGYVLGILLAGAAGAGAGWALWDRWRQDPWQRLQQRIVARLRSLGVDVALHHPPRTQAARVRATLGPGGEALAALLEALDRERYAAAAGSGSGKAPRRPDRGWTLRFERAAAGARGLARPLGLAPGAAMAPSTGRLQGTGRPVQPSESASAP